MPPPDEPEVPDFTALLERLLDSSLSSVPTTMTGRLGRLAGTAAKTAASMAWKRVTGRGGALDARLADRLALSAGELKGLAMKVGQILSYTDDSLPEEARRALATLQTHSPPVPFEAIAAVVKEDLGGRAEELLARMDHRPVAAASIGQVHRARLPDGSAVAVKVQYPGIERALGAEFSAAGAGVSFARLLVPGGNMEAFIAEAKERVLAECDYRQELEWQRRFGELFKKHRVLRVPGVHPDYSARRVLTSEWRDGIRLDQWLDRNPWREERNRVGRALYELYVGTLLRQGVFNGDPHPGNYLFAPDGTLVVLDYGCVRRFSAAQVRAYTALGEAVRADDLNEMRAALRGLGGVEPGDAEGWRAARTLFRAFFAPTLEDRVQRIEPTATSSMGQLFADKKAIARLNLPGECLFLFRIKFGLHAVLARIGAEANWQRLESRWSSGADLD